MRKLGQVSVLSFVFTLFFACSALAHSISEIAVNVRLNDDGSARISQIWHAEISGKGTEFYIPQGSLGDMEIKDFRVSDEDGNEFTNEGTKWNPKRSASEKKGRCGMVKTADGFELCWGIGDQGSHVYKIEWTFTNFIKAYDDYDGFNVRLINDSIKPSPEKVSVTVEKPDYAFKSGDVDMWAFGYTGTILPVDGKIVAESAPNRVWDEKNYLTVMLRFKKGLFKPSSRVDSPFSSLADKALQGTSSQSSVSKIDMGVLLTDDGSARVIQRWHVHSNGIGEFSYLLGRLDDMEVRDFSVTDESGKVFVCEEPNSDKASSGEKKDGNCRITAADNGTELRWSRGSAGAHTYTLKWTQTNVVKAFDDFDGLDLLLLDSKQEYKPEQFKTVVGKSKYRFKDSDAEAWAFDLNASVSHDDGRFIVSLLPNTDLAKADGAFVRLMMKFNKGIFHPTAKVTGTFDSVMGKEISSLKSKNRSYIMIGALLFFSVIALLFRRPLMSLTGRLLPSGRKYGSRSDIMYDEPISSFGYTAKYSNEFKEAQWFRDIPFDGDIRLVTFAILNTPYASKVKKTSMVEAYFLRLIQKGVLLVNESLGEPGETAITVLKTGNTELLSSDEGEFFDMLSEAAGANGILEKSEFKIWGNKIGNGWRMGKWMASFEPYGSSYFLTNDLARLTESPSAGASSKRKEAMYAELARRMELSFEDLKRRGRIAPLTINGTVALRKTVGFRKYLLDFTLINERRAVEVELWNDYLVLATVFNCAKEVSAELLNLKPDFHSAVTELITADMADITDYTTIFKESLTEFYSDTSDSGSQSDSYDSSSGGSSYSSGGGGSSGGGSGGGIR